MRRVLLLFVIGVFVCAAQTLPVVGIGGDGSILFPGTVKIGNTLLSPSTLVAPFTATIVDGGNKNANWLSRDRATLYGIGGTTVYSSTDEGVTWTTIANVSTATSAGCAGNLQFVRELWNGELLVSCYGTPGTLYKTTGYPQRGASATWALVLTASAQNYFNNYDVSVYGSLAFVSEYGPNTTASPNNARYGYMSTDYGATWTNIYDVNAVVPNAGTGDHTHGIFYDPWWDAVWVINGDAHQATSVSFDHGTTWTVVDTVKQFVAVIPMEKCILFTTDMNSNGVYRIERTKDKSISSITLAYAVSASTTLDFVGAPPFRALGPDMPALIPFYADPSSTQNGLILATYDGYNFTQIWRDTITYSGKGPQNAIGPTVNNKIVSALYDARQTNFSRLTFGASPSRTYEGMTAQQTSAINRTLAGLPLGATEPGFYYSGTGTSTAASTRSVGNLSVTPITFNRSVILDRIGLEITASGTAGSLVRLGIYASDSYGAPGALILDAGTIDGTQAAGWYEITISQTLSAGTYWLAAVPLVASPTMRCSVGAAAAGIGSATALTASGGVLGYVNGSVSGGLPNPFSITSASGTIPRVLVRVQ